MVSLPFPFSDIVTGFSPRSVCRRIKGLAEEVAAGESEGRSEISPAEDPVTRGFSTVRTYCRGVSEGFGEKPSV